MKNLIPVLGFLSLSVVSFSSYAQEFNVSSEDPTAHIFTEAMQERSFQTDDFQVNNPPRFGGGDRGGPGYGDGGRWDDRGRGPGYGGGRYGRARRPWPTRPGYPGPGYGDSVENILCGSDHYRYNTCSTRVPGYIVDFRLISQRSHTACIYGQNYGASNNYVWVDRGCEGVFRVTLRRY